MQKVSMFHCKTILIMNKECNQRREQIAKWKSLIIYPRRCQSMNKGRLGDYVMIPKEDYPIAIA